MKKTNSKNQDNRPPILFYIILFLLPVVFLILLELGLRVFDYGRNLDAFITLSEEYDNYLFTNPDLPFRYASNMETPPAVSLDAFLKEKSDTTFRIFVMGGSSTAGFPYAYNATFPRYIKRKLEIVYPNVNFEVINLGITAHNSYTVADLSDDVIKQKPDLVLVYAGHNEYYGILGVGSTIKFGNSVFLSKVIISLNKYKTFQLVNNLIKGAGSLFSNEDKIASNETLMSRMIGENDIPFNSELYFNGIEQFQTNMEEFLQDMNSKGIKVIIGGLTSNLIQKPFTSLIGNTNTKADSFYTKGKENLDENNIEAAKNMLLSAKEYDGIRFRAPEKMNATLKELSSKYNYTYINIDSVFRENSENGIVGYNLMVDHLHPNIDGYNLIGEEFYKKIISENLLSKFDKTIYTDSVLNSIVQTKFLFTKLDSTISKLRIDALLNSYPFVSKNFQANKRVQYNIDSFIDSIAIEMINKNISWRSAHQLVAEWYYNNKKYDKFMSEMDAIIANQPYVEIPYAFTISRLINVNLFNEAEKYLYPLHKLNPSDYTYKWIGSFALNKGDFQEAIDNLTQSSKLNPNDPQVYYNLSGAYFNIGNISEAKKAIEKSIALNPNNPSAINFYNSLKSLK